MGDTAGFLRALTTSLWDLAALSDQESAPRQGLSRSLLEGLMGRRCSLTLATGVHSGEQVGGMNSCVCSPCISAQASMIQLARQFADREEFGEAELPELTRRSDISHFEGRSCAEVDALIRRLTYGRTSRRAEDRVLAKVHAARTEEVRADGVLREYILGRATRAELDASRIRLAFRWGRLDAAHTAALEAAIAMGAPALDDPMASMVAGALARGLRRLPAATAARLAADARAVEAFASAAAH